MKGLRPVLAATLNNGSTTLDLSVPVTDWATGTICRCLFRNVDLRGAVHVSYVYLTFFVFMNYPPAFNLLQREPRQLRVAWFFQNSLEQHVLCRQHTKEIVQRLLVRSLILAYHKPLQGAVYKNTATVQ